MTHSLTANRVTLIRGETCLIDDLSFTLQAGQLLLLNGRNGSGKTSLMKALVGLLDLESGSVLWDGEDVRHSRLAQRAALVWLGHRTGLKADLTLGENLSYERSLHVPADIDLESVLERLELLTLRRLPLRALSAGQQRRVALARLLLSAAPLWMMDEPFTNLDVDGRALVTSMLESHVQRGGMAVVAAHMDIDIDAPTERLVLL